MFKNIGDKITEKIEEIGDAVKEAIKANSTPFDVSKFNNPIAERTDWKPLKPGGTNFRTHEIYEKAGEVQFKATKGSLLFSGFFMALGIIVPALLIIKTVTSNSSLDNLTIMFVLAPVVFFIAGFFLFRHSTKPIIFSKTTGYYCKGRLKKDKYPDPKKLKDHCKLIDIVALQIVSEYVRSSSGSSGSSSRSTSFRSYEINLILQDASRLNVIDHGKKNKLMEDAEKLAAFLRVPVWEGSGTGV